MISITIYLSIHSENKGHTTKFDSGEMIPKMEAFHSSFLSCGILSVNGSVSEQNINKG